MPANVKKGHRAGSDRTDFAPAKLEIRAPMFFSKASVARGRLTHSGRKKLPDNPVHSRRSRIRRDLHRRKFKPRSLTPRRTRETGRLSHMNLILNRCGRVKLVAGQPKSAADDSLQQNGTASLGRWSPLLPAAPAFRPACRHTAARQP